RMANIAQTVNVLQAMILTRQEQILLTPTYHVFEMYSVHQDATMVPVDVQSERYEYGEYSVPALSASASVDRDGRLHVTLSNANPNQELEVQLNVRGLTARTVQGRILHAKAMNTHNTFENPDIVKPQPFTGATLTADGLQLQVPRMAVVALELR
ncbi:MAG: alpha-N-arabinofuranosidase, partial [Caldilineaceae bacterium]|nr:alpha-N-arabinofuranosidase [Caldilineaceae bacterium]